jgi:8-oxo-dGTP pyrophosphatase MutT (NUDIX family)
VQPQGFATVILVDHRGWLLLQERDSQAPIAPDKWGMVGGHVEEGEDFEAAAYRELAEETGIAWTSGLDLWFQGPFHRGTGEVAQFAVWFAATGVAPTSCWGRAARSCLWIPWRYPSWTCPRVPGNSCWASWSPVSMPRCRESFADNQRRGAQMRTVR